MIRKRIFAIFLIFILLFSSLPVSAHHSYFISVTIDPDAMQYIGTINYEDNDVGYDNHAEYKNGAVFAVMPKNAWSKVYNDCGEAYYWSLIGSEKIQLAGFYMNDLKLGSDWTQGVTGLFSTGKVSMAFTFPGLHENHDLGFNQNDANANTTDKELAERVLNYPIEDLNNCLSFIRSHCYGGKSQSSRTVQTIATKLAWGVANKNSNKKITINGKTVMFSEAENPDLRTNDGSITTDDYVTVTIDSTSRDFCHQCPKGYVGDKATANKDSNMTKALKDYDDPEYITWDLIVAQGNYNADVSGLSFSTLDTLVNPGVFTSLVGKLLGGIVDGVRYILGLQAMNDLMLIQNKVKTNWVYGLFPADWLGAAMLTYTICLMIAMSLFGFSILKLLWKKQLSTVNIGEKIAMQEGIKNLIVTLFLMVAFIPIFAFLAGLNASIVKLMASSINVENFLARNAWNIVNLGSIFLAIAELIIDIYFNFFYVVRAMTLAFLIGVAPLAIYTLSLGGKISGVFSTYMKELISNIFVQSVHAIIAAFFFNMSYTATLNTFTKLVVMYSFIPITNFVKTKIFQLTDGPASAVAGAGSAGMVGMASGVAGGLFGQNKQSGGRNSGGAGGGASGGDSRPLDASSSLGRLSQKNERSKNGDAVKFEDGNVYNGQKIKPNNASGMLSGIGNVALHSLSGAANFGMGVGMTAIGQNGSKYFDQAGKHMGQGLNEIGAGVQPLINRGLNNSALNELRQAGIEKISYGNKKVKTMINGHPAEQTMNTTAFTMAIDSNIPSAYNRALVENIRDTFNRKDEAGINHYMQQGIVGVDDPKADKLSIHFDQAKLNTFRNKNNPLLNVRMYQPKPDK